MNNLLNIINTGRPNYLSDNPQITFNEIIHRKYTEFAVRTRIDEAKINDNGITFTIPFSSDIEVNTLTYMSIINHNHEDISLDDIEEITVQLIKNVPTDMTNPKIGIDLILIHRLNQNFWGGIKLIG